MLIAFSFFVPGYLIHQALQPGEGSVPQPVSQTAYSTRIQGPDPTDLSLRVTDMRFRTGERAPLLVAAPAGDTLSGLLALRFSAPPVGAALVMLPDSPPLSEGTVDRMRTVAGDGAPLISLGPLDPEVRQQLDPYFEITSIPETGEHLAMAVDEILLGWREYSERLIFVPDEDHRFALAAATWIAHSGDPVYPVGKDELSPELQDHLRKVQLRRSGSAEMNLYLLAPRALATSPVLERLNEFGQAVRVAGMTPQDTALSLAQYYDAGAGFGWWTGAVRDADRVYLVGNPDRCADLIAVAPLFGESQRGPTILTTDADISCTVETYLWTLSPHWAVSPSDAPFVQAWIAGCTESVVWSAQARMDRINEAVPYDRQGFGGLDALSLVWLFSSGLGGIWVWIHSSVRRPAMKQQRRLLWVVAALVLGAVGLLAYYLAVREELPGADLAVPAPSVKALSYCVGVMSITVAVIMLTGLVYLLLGRPLWIIDGSLFALGNPEVRSLIAGYVLSLVLMILLVEPGLSPHRRESYSALLKRTAPAPALTLTWGALVFSLALWWLRRQYLTVPPRPEELLWWGTGGAAAVAAVLLTYPLSYWMTSQKVSESEMS